MYISNRCSATSNTKGEDSEATGKLVKLTNMIFKAFNCIEAVSIHTLITESDYNWHFVFR